METYRKLRLDILIEAALKSRLIELLDQQGVSGYTIFSAVGGRGESGVWMRATQISEINQMLLFICILEPERGDTVLDAVFEKLSNHIGYVGASNVEVIRPSKFP